MKKKRIRIASVCTLAALVMVLWCAQALAEDAEQAQRWMVQFAQALEQLAPRNDAEQTGDPARAGQYLIEYEFGTVLSAVPETPIAQEIMEIDVRTEQVTDWRGVRVGMGMEAALGQRRVGAGSPALVVLETQENGPAWSWAYVGPEGVYGVEYIAYAADAAGLTEYTLTYVMDGGVISAIRIKTASATEAQAQEGLSTAREIAEKQSRTRIVRRSEAPVFEAGDLQVQGGRALGVQVAELIAHMGEPQDVQVLPEAQGRLLLYDGAVVRLAFQVETGEELVRGVSVRSAAIEGPRGMRTGMPVEEAAARFACETDVSERGGVLYLAGEAAGEPPYGEVVASASGVVLRYACQTETGETAWLEAGVADGVIEYWALQYADDAQGGM